MKSVEKVLGDVTELDFMSKIIAMGGVASKPYGDNADYDVVVDFNGILKRIQIKATTTLQGRENSKAYAVVAGKGKSSKNPYSETEVDFIAAKAVPENTWYIIPVSKINGVVKIYLQCNKPDSTRKFEKYKEAWSQLTDNCAV